MRAIIALLSGFLLCHKAFAVPVPWTNCGTAGNVVSVQELTANEWPPENAGPTGPIFALAKVHPDSARIERLRVALFPLNWVFELNDDIQGHVKDGFVSLPHSWLSNGSPPMRIDTENFRGLPDLGTDHYLDQLPVPAGPVNSIVYLPSFSDPTAFALSIKAVIATPIPSMNASFSIAVDGKPGFPVQPQAGTVYADHLDITGTSGSQVFCMDVSIPTEFAQTLGSAVEPVHLGDFRAFPGKGELTLNWSYGDDDEAIPSSAMDPSAEVQGCTGGRGALEGEHIESFYDPASRIWIASLPSDETGAGCTEVFIRSGLTGQVDGPFRVGDY